MRLSTPICNTVPLEDYVEGWFDTDLSATFLRYVETKDNVVFFSGLHAHYVTNLKKNDGFILIDGHPVYRCIFYYDILVLLNDLEKFREIGSFTMHHVKRYETNASNVIDLHSNNVDQEENESGQEIGKYHPSAIWASSIDLVEDADDICVKLEQYWFERYFERSREMPMPALENEKKMCSGNL
ncbi:hypothetical protein PVAND_016289 [Polypedilum vanderplanki]|uniref:Uncharacterized protein n=1 Tax=Polypedilum vanderplanki TaxID=319348 RepID=A0A9J6BEQ0_POLVA|nr:hypothetical protein PVAND_016289 [Polypedilum vanderplanki]